MCEYATGAEAKRKLEGEAPSEPRNILKFLTADHADEYGGLATKERREHESFLGFVVPSLGGLLDAQRMNVNRMIFNLNIHPQPRV